MSYGQRHYPGGQRAVRTGAKSCIETWCIVPRIRGRRLYAYGRQVAGPLAILRVYDSLDSWPYETRRATSDCERRACSTGVLYRRFRTWSRPGIAVDSHIYCSMRDKRHQASGLRVDGWMDGGVAQILGGDFTAVSHQLTRNMIGHTG